MSKESLIKSINVVEKDDMKYAVIYAVRGCKYNGPVNTIALYFSKDEAEKAKEICFRVDIYDSVWVVAQMVWF